MSIDLEVAQIYQSSQMYSKPSIYSEIHKESDYCKPHSEYKSHLEYRSYLDSKSHLDPRIYLDSKVLHYDKNLHYDSKGSHYDIKNSHFDCKGFDPKNLHYDPKSSQLDQNRFLELNRSHSEYNRLYSNHNRSHSDYKMYSDCKSNLDVNRPQCHSDSKEENFTDIRSDLNSSHNTLSSRRESVASRSASEWNWTGDYRTDEKISPGACSITSSVFKNSMEENKTVDQSLGIMELSLAYDSENATLHCIVYRAKNLIPMDINGLADPFCKLNILPSTKTSTRLRTKTVHKTRNPEFNENLTFYDISESDLKEKSLHILVVDDDKYGHDYMGETRIKLNKLRFQKTIYVSIS